MSFFSNLLRNKRERSSDIARDRLLMVLVHDRVKLTPDIMERLKVEISEVIARYVPHVDPDAIQVTLLPGDSIDHLKADIPLRRNPEL